MTSALLITRRELGSYFRSMPGYIIAAVLLLVDGLLFQAFALGGDDQKRSADVLGAFFYVSSGTTMIASVLLSMRLIAEERQTGTLVLLTSSPIKDWQIVVGKFLSSLIFLGVVSLATVYMPLLIMVHGKISAGQVVAGYLGIMLLGSASLAIGTFGSALARTQVLAAIISGCIVVAMIIVWLLAKVTDQPFNEFFTALALHGRHFPPFMQGAIHARDVVYYLVLTYFFLFAATRVMEARRWR